VRIVMTCLTLFATSIMAGCECKPQPIEIKVPVKCVVPEVLCDFNRSTSAGVISAMLECIIDQKKAAGVCK